MKHGYLRQDAGSNNSDQARLKIRVDRTSSALERLRGLLFRSPLAAGQGLLIVPCNSVHTFFMGYSIDVVYLDSQCRVVKVVETVAPFRMSMATGAAAVLELAAGEAKKSGIEVGTMWVWEEA